MTLEDDNMTSILSSNINNSDNEMNENTKLEGETVDARWQKDRHTSWPRWFNRLILMVYDDDEHDNEQWFIKDMSIIIFILKNLNHFPFQSSLKLQSDLCATRMHCILCQVSGFLRHFSTSYITANKWYKFPKHLNVSNVLCFPNFRIKRKSFNNSYSEKISHMLARSDNHATP